MTQKIKTSHWFSLIWMLIIRELKVRYRGSILGYAWSMLNPLLMMTILTLVFSHFMRFKMENYSVFVLSGIICWNMFAQSLQLGVNGIINNASLLKKVKVPAWVFPSANLGSSVVNMLLAIIPYVCISLFVGNTLTWKLILFPLVLLPYLVMIQGLVLILSSLNVLFRDIGHMLEPVLQILFYASPVLYSRELLPENLQGFFAFNPMFYYLKGFRLSLCNIGELTLLDVTAMVGCALVFMALGLYVHKKLEKKYIYYL